MSEEDCPKCEQGLPAWLATFADLMSLLMCFFVLLLSFAEIDAIRFKKMAESMKDAFGVQREIPATEIVKGVSVIKQEFSPATTEATIVNEIRQETKDESREDLDVNDDVMDAVAEKIEQEIQEQADELREALADEIAAGLLNIETEDSRIIIRIQEKGSFPSGSAQLDPGFFDVMNRISATVSEMTGKIRVAGHTDNIPISTQRFRSNWELSSARAVTVVHALLSNPNVAPERVLIEGYADSQPLGPNDTAANRAINRRVELILLRDPNNNDVDQGDVIDDGAGKNDE